MGLCHRPDWQNCHASDKQITVQFFSMFAENQVAVTDSDNA